MDTESDINDRDVNMRIILLQNFDIILWLETCKQTDRYKQTARER